MKFLTPGAHVALDYGLVVLFAMAPFLWEMGDIPEALCWVVAATHLLLSLLTAYPGGVTTAMAFETHGVLELLGAAALAVAPWVLDFSAEPIPRTLFLASGVGLLGAWMVTDYRVSETPPPTRFRTRERRA